MRSTIHEIRNQLAVAVANIEAFIDGKLPPAPDRLAAVLQALNKVDTLLDSLAPATSPGPAAARMRPVDICALMVSEAIAIEASAVAAGIAFDVDICSHDQLEHSRFLCDPVQVSQVIKNVLLNALKYTGRGGRVKLYCRREPGVIALEVSDSGPGVPLGERQAIFERGVRGSASPSAAGSGFGLAVVRGILDAHGGTVSVADSPSGGACFVIRLPVESSSLLHETVTPLAYHRRMSTISERTLVHCSVNQAEGHLARYFQARGNSDGDVAKLSLRAEVPVPGSKEGVRLERTAIATIVPRRTPGDMLPHYAVTWAAEKAGPYPTFNGDLAIESGDDYTSFYLALNGSYEPPLGAVGAAFDAVVGHRIAVLTARNLLSVIADSIEADFVAVEQTKAGARQRERTPIKASP